MSATFSLQLDTSPPANPVLLLNGGEAVTGARIVQVSITTPDAIGGSEDVSQMRLWGDVDPTADPLVQPLEAASSWIAYQSFYNVTLSLGDGVKTIYARLVDVVGNQTLPFSSVITLDTLSPVVTITATPDRSRISEVDGYDQTSFTWSPNQDAVEYRVRVVPTERSPWNSGIAIPQTFGSQNVGGTGLFPASQPITTTIDGQDLAVASPGDTLKLIKTFVRNAAGLWSA